MKTNKLVQGAMIAAMFGVMSILNTMSGTMFDTLIGYFMVVPFVYYSYHSRLRESLIVALVSLFIVFLQGQLMFSLIALETCGFGIVIGECLKRKKSGGVMLFSSFIVSFIINILIYEVFAGVLGISMHREMVEMYDMIVKQVPTMKQRLSVTTFTSLIPLAILFMSVLESYVVILLTQVVLMRVVKNKIQFPAFFHIAYFKLNRVVGYIVLVVYLVCQALLVRNNNIVLRYLDVIAMVIIMVDGMSVVSFYLLEHHPKLAGASIILLFIPPINMALLLVGIIDIISDLKAKIMYNRKVKEGGM